MVSDALRMNLSIGLAILTRRKMRGLSQARLAAAADVDLLQLQQIERGVLRTAATTLARIAIALDCGVAELFIDLSARD
jgi:transcriptional regulator with XRE-family HTH domain